MESFEGDIYPTSAAQWTCTLFVPAGRNQYHATGASRGSDATYRHHYRGHLFSVFESQLASGLLCSRADCRATRTIMNIVSI